MSSGHVNVHVMFKRGSKMKLTRHLELVNWIMFEDGMNIVNDLIKIN